MGEVKALSEMQLGIKVIHLSYNVQLCEINQLLFVQEPCTIFREETGHLAIQFADIQLTSLSMPVVFKCCFPGIVLSHFANISESVLPILLSYQQKLL